VRLRNTEQARLLLEAPIVAPRTGCSTLFDGVDGAREGKRRKELRKPVPRLTLRARRAEPTPIEIQLRIGGWNFPVHVLSPVAASDALWVELSPESFATLVAYLRTSSFEEEDEAGVGNGRVRKAQDLPKGLQRQGDYFRVSYLNGEGQSRMKRCRTLEGAISFQTLLDEDGTLSVAADSEAESDAEHISAVDAA